MSSLEIKHNKAYKHYNEADRIISYLLDPKQEVDLTDTDKKNLDHAYLIHGLRRQYHKRADVIKMIVATCRVTPKHAYQLLNMTEEIFGKVEGVHKDYERNFLLEVSRKNIQTAVASGSSTAMSKAIMAHYKVAGLDEYIVDMPDFASLEQHQYIINLTPATIDALKQVLKSGAVRLSDVIPPPNINLNGIEEAQTE